MYLLPQFCSINIYPFFMQISAKGPNQNIRNELFIRIFIGQQAIL